MNRSALLSLGIGLAIGVLVALVGFRFSHVSADVTVIAKELADATVLSERLDAALAARQQELLECSQRGLALQRDLQALNQRANQCENDRAELERSGTALQTQLTNCVGEASALKARADAVAKAMLDERSRHEREQAKVQADIVSRDKRIADLSSDISEPGRLRKRNAELAEANSRLDRDLQSCKSALSELEVKSRSLDSAVQEAEALRQQVLELRQRIQEITPPTVDASKPTKFDQWNSLVALQQAREAQSVQRREPPYSNLLLEADFRDELGDPDVQLLMTDADSGEWSEKSWREELFPRYRCARTGWPQPLVAVSNGVEQSKRHSRRGSYRVLLWNLNKDFLGVAVCTAYETNPGRRNSNRIVCETTLRREAFPDLRR